MGSLSIQYNNGVIGSGGYATGGDIADDGTVVSRCDSTGPVIRGPATTQWSRLFKPGINADGTLLDIKYGGDGTTNTYDCATYDVAICATNALIAYFVVMGYVWKTTDGGTTITRTSSTQFDDCAANETARMTGKPLAVDPQNAAVVFFGAPDGLHISANSGATWTDVSTGDVPVPTAGQRMIVVFDRHSAVSGGKTQGIYVFVNGSGLYRSTNGGSTWAAVAGTPTTSAAHMRVSTADGYVHIAGDGSNSIDAQYRRWDGSSWIAPTGISSKAIAISTINAGRMWLCEAGGALRVSTDNGVTWSASGGALRTAPTIPWMAWTNENFMSNGAVEFDPISGRLWMLEGIGAWKLVSPPTSISGSITWTEASVGIENMVTTLVDVAPDGRVLYACHDRTGFAITRSNAGSVYPSQHAVNDTVAIVHGGNMDSDPDDQNNLVVCNFPWDNNNSTKGGYSTNGGTSWTAFTESVGEESGFYGGGNIIALTDQIFIQIQTNDGWLMRTTDGGVNWTRCTIGNNNDSVAHHAYYLHRRCLVKDEHVAGQAYLYLIGDGSGDADNLACRGIWKTTDYGATWARIKSTYIISYGADFFNGKFRQYGANDWLWCGGDGALGLWRSMDGMVTWAQITSTDDIFGAVSWGEVLAVAVGKEITSGAPKTVMVSGFRQASPEHATSYAGFGTWISTDGMANWTRLAQFPNGYFSQTADIAGDPAVFGLFYYGLPGEGLMKIQVLGQSVVPLLYLRVAGA